MPRLLAKYSVLSHITWTALIKRSFKTAITASESRFEPLTCGQHAKGKSHKGSRCATCVCLGLEDMDKDKKEPKNQINANAVVTWQQWPCRFVWAGVGCHEGFRRKRRNERPERELEVQKFTPPLTPPGGESASLFVGRFYCQSFNTATSWREKELLGSDTQVAGKWGGKLNTISIK